MHARLAKLGVAPVTIFTTTTYHMNISISIQHKKISQLNQQDNAATNR